MMENISKKEKLLIPSIDFPFSTKFSKAFLIRYIKNIGYMANFRLFETQRVCRRQFWILGKCQKLLQYDRKYRGKWRKCLLRAISPFPKVFSEYF